MENTIGLDRISPSMLMEYENCPKLFYYRSFLGIKLPQPQRHLKFGSAIHLAIDNIYEQHDESDGWSLADKSIPIKIFKGNFTRESLSDEDGNSEEEIQRIYSDMLKDGVEIIDAFWGEKEILRAKGIMPTTFELPIKMRINIPESEGEWELPISCRIDGINEKSTPEKITEFKTSSKSYDYNETRNSLQSLSYASVRYCMTGKIPEVDYVVMRKGVKKDRIQHLSIVYEKADLLAFDQKVKSIFQKIKNREFGRPLKNHANYCDCYKFDRLLNTN